MCGCMIQAGKHLSARIITGLVRRKAFLEGSRVTHIQFGNDLFKKLLY